jgi:protoporphyrin/coproporphyrin ferrochelatase
MQTAIVLMNLGTPSASQPAAIRSYLREFLSDRRVVEIPRAVWYPILYGTILPLRPRRLAHAYQQIWSQYGDSPLRAISRRQVERLQEKFDTLGTQRPVVRLAMTYGAPRLRTVVEELRAAGIDRIVVLPLYPQYSATTTAPIYDQMSAIVAGSRDIPSHTIVKQYWDHPAYVEALAQSVLDFWARNGRGRRLLMSFHGIPKRNVDRGDPYGAQCAATASRLATRLGLDASQWRLSFQSRLGRAEWLQPYTSATLRDWGSEQLASVDVICPAFAADCLETLEEIAVENRHVFQDAGGGDFRYIPCLNDSDTHMDMLFEILRDYLPPSIFDKK